MSHILGMYVVRNRSNKALKIHQTTYIQEVLERFGLANAKPISMPISDRNALSKAKPEEQQANQSLYQQAIGCLTWISKGTRPDIQYAVGQLSQHCSEPTVRHWNAVLRVMRYLKGTAEYSLSYSANQQLKLQGYCDADYAGDTDERHSVSGHIYFLGGGPITWNSVKQRCIATSTTESEYISLAEASKQGQWIRALLKELHRTQYLNSTLAVPIFSDNQAAIALAKDPISHSRTKHIEVRYHYIRELVTYGKTVIDYISTNEMVADILTKPLPLTAYKRCIEGLLSL